MTNFNSKRLVFIDESGLAMNMTRNYGRIIGGKRLVDSVPGAYWNITSIVSSIRMDGSITAMTINGPIDGNSFLAYVSQILCPSLRPDDIVIMDNLACHKSAEVLRLIEDTGAELWYLPAYSPDYNPIEKMWSKIKAILRKIKARTQKDLNRAISKSLRMVTADDSIGWFKSCGYTLIHS
jgi:transposase